MIRLTNPESKRNPASPPTQRGGWRLVHARPQTKAPPGNGGSWSCGAINRACRISRGTASPSTQPGGGRLVARPQTNAPPGGGAKFACLMLVIMRGFADLFRRTASPPTQRRAAASVAQRRGDSHRLKQTVTQICYKPARRGFSVRPSAQKSPAAQGSERGWSAPRHPRSADRDRVSHGRADAVPPRPFGSAGAFVRSRNTHKLF